MSLFVFCHPFYEYSDLEKSGRGNLPSPKRPRLDVPIADHQEQPVDIPSSPIAPSPEPLALSLSRESMEVQLTGQTVNVRNEWGMYIMFKKAYIC